MVQIQREDVGNQIRSLQPNKRMPSLCSANRSFGWRIISEDYEKHAKAIRSEVHDIINSRTGKIENYLTCMALSEDGIAALGSGNKEGPLYFVQDLSAVKDIPQGPRFRLLSQEEIGAPIYSIDWSNNHILVGTTKGSTKLLRFDMDYGNGLVKSLSTLGEYDIPISEIPMSSSSFVPNTHVKTVQFSPTYGNTSAGELSIHEASSSSCFLTTAISQLQIWNVEQPSLPLMRNNPSELPLTTASWSPTHPHSLIACGGEDKAINIIDIRVPPSTSEEQQQSVWRTENAHDRSIRDVQFNPFIPYWLASAGEDAIVNIWDIRATCQKPVAKIDGLNGIVTSVTWSNIRPENLCTSSDDGAMRCFTLSPEQFPVWDTYYRLADYDYDDTLPIVRQQSRDASTIWSFNKIHHQNIDNGPSFTHWLSRLSSTTEGQTEMNKSKKSTMLLTGALGLGEWGIPEPGTVYKGENLANARGSVMQVKASKCRPCTYYSITDGGQLSSHTVRFDISSHLRSRHRFDPEDKTDLSAEIEDDIYCRRISKAQEKLHLLKIAPIHDEQEARQRREEVDFLEECLILRDPITDWAPNSMPDKSKKRISRRFWSEDDLWESAINTFKFDLKYWSYRIPPGCNTAFAIPLDLNEPIIAPHLVEEEKLVKELPPLVGRRESVESFYAYTSPKYNHDLSEQVDASLLELNEDETSATKEETEKGADTTIMEGRDEPLPIKDRRSRRHIPPIYTPKQSMDLGQHQNMPTPLTPPQSATDTKAPAASENTNPFITETEHSPAPTPHVTNPFEMNEQANKAAATYLAAQNGGASTNPFENETSIGASDQSGTYPIHLNNARTLRSSFDSSLEEEKNQTSEVKSKHHHLMRNPFKKYLSRNSSRYKEDHQPSNVDNNGNRINRQSAELMRRFSSRRNALHGPF